MAGRQSRTYNPDEDWFTDPLNPDSETNAKRKRWKKGSVLDVLAKMRLPQGPQSVKELFNYPEQLVQAAFSKPEWQDRCVDLLRWGVVEHSDYSGIFAEREAKRLLFMALGQCKGIHVPHMVRKTCDIDPSSQRVLLHMSEVLDAGESCVFADIRAQLHPEAQEWCLAASPKPEDSIKAKEDAYQAMADFLLENGHWAVDQDCCLGLDLFAWSQSMLHKVEIWSCTGFSVSQITYIIHYIT